MMNGMQAVTAGAVSPSAAVASVFGGVESGQGALEGNSAFAALVASLLGGSAVPAEGQGATLLGLIAGAAQPEGMTSEEVSEEQAVTDAIVAEMAAWIATLSSEQQQRLASKPEVAEWLALANGELAMSGLEEEVRGERATKTQDASADGGPDGKMLTDVWNRLTKALEASPEHRHLAAVARQGAMVMASESPLSKQLQQANAVVETAESAKSEAATGARWSHLAALEAKSTWVRVAGTETVPTESRGEPVPSEQPHGSSGLEATTKLSTSDSLPKSEAGAARLTLPEATEQLKEWMLKQSSGGGDFKAETILKLKPEHLGQVEVKLTMQNGQLAATITADSAMAKEALEANLPTLRLNLQSQGVAVERLVVSQQTNGQPSGFEQDGRRQQQAGRDSSRDGRSRKEQDAEDWMEALSIKAGLSPANLELYGNSFRAEA